MIPQDIIIVDGFYADPERVRQMALQVEYNTFGNLQNFPGAESKKHYFTANHEHRFQELVGHPILVTSDTLVFGKFRYSTQYDFAQTQVHLDHGIAWTGVVYLTRDEDCRGGLGIYRHKKTGLQHAPTLEELASYGCQDISEFDAKYVYLSTKDEDAWELVHEIPIRYNRLILFPGSKYFHGITMQFGNSIEDSRLTQNFFFQKVR